MTTCDLTSPFARSSIALDANNNALTNAVIQNGHIGAATLRELGVKSSAFAGRLFMSHVCL